MENINFNLNVYYQDMRYVYKYIDFLFKQKNESKSDVLKKFGIGESTYRSNRASENVKNNNHVVLLNFFHAVDYSNDLDAISDFFNGIMFAVYYKNENLMDKYLLDLSNYLLNESLLNPLFMIFKILILMNQNKAYDCICFEIKNDVLFLKNIDEKYFNKVFFFLYNCILIYFQDKGLFNEMSIDKFYGLDWVYYHIQGYIYYINNDYSKAQIFFTYARNIYKNELNLKRYIAAEINLLAIYNMQGLYAFTITEGDLFIKYLRYQTNFEKWISYALNHIFVAFVELKKYKEVLSFLRIHYVKDYLIGIGAICVLITLYELKKTIDEVNNYLADAISTKKVGLAYRAIYGKNKLTEDEYNSNFANYNYSYVYEKYLK